MGSGGLAPPLLTSTADGGEWSDSRPGRFTPGERASGIHSIGGWGGGGVAEPVWTLWSREKSLALAGNRTQPVTIPTQLSRNL
jgi:hypothetical protein